MQAKRAWVWITSTVLTLVLSGGMSSAEEAAKPPTLDGVVKQVETAASADDKAALEALSKQRAHDPWMVAERLCVLGKFDVATAYANAAGGEATKALPAYVVARKANPPSAADWDELESTLQAIGKQDAKEVERRTETLSAEKTVIAVQSAYARGWARTQRRDFVAAAGDLEQAATVARTIGWHDQAYRALGQAGACWWYAGKSVECRRVTQTQLEVGQALKDPLLVGRAQSGLGLTYVRTRQFDKAIEMQRLAIESLKGHPVDEARALRRLAAALRRANRGDEAVPLIQRSIELSEAANDRRGLAEALGVLAGSQEALGDYGAALRARQQSLRLSQQGKDDRGTALCYDELGRLYRMQGDLPRSLSYHKRAIKMRTVLKDRTGLAVSHSAIAVTLRLLGKYPEALAHLDEAIVHAKATDRLGAMAAARSTQAAIHSLLGDDERALASMREAEKLYERARARSGQAMILGNIGIVQRRLGELEESVASLEQGLAIARSIGDVRNEANILANLASSHGDAGDGEKERATLREALAKFERIKQRAKIAFIHRRIGESFVRDGMFEEGATHLDRAVRDARRLRIAPELIGALQSIGHMHLQQGDHDKALAAAREALRELEDILGGLGEEEGANARARRRGVYEIGIAAAAHTQAFAEAFAFLESGRAGALLESLGGRDSLRWTDLPEGLAEEEAEAKTAVRAARRAYGKAIQSGLLEEGRKASTALDAAQEKIRDIATRIQRVAKREASLFYPRAATIEEAQAMLQPGEALLLYALVYDRVLCLVTTPDVLKIVQLGPREPLEKAAEAVRALDAGDDATETLATLRKTLVEPLKLSDAITTVIVSPEGPLAYVPFGALFDQAVCLTPSGTTHALLAQQLTLPGKRVLALGDPVYAAESAAQRIYYRGRMLTSLPATRPEVEAIGDVKLLGAKANEAALAEALATSDRWRAVHIACHGLIDPNNPMLSSLALSSTENGDGFLTALEVLRMEIPTDLAVLSACDTGRGTVVTGEGIVGLTRAFMYAGASRVMCSLWQVDDAATQALMVKFYELWNPKDGSTGVDAAVALKQAQEHIRSQEKWKDPYYWAAWVLWGLAK